MRQQMALLFVRLKHRKHAYKSICFDRQHNSFTVKSSRSQQLRNSERTSRFLQVQSNTIGQNMKSLAIILFLVLVLSLVVDHSNGFLRNGKKRGIEDEPSRIDERGELRGKIFERRNAKRSNIFRRNEELRNREAKDNMINI